MIFSFTVKRKDGQRYAAQNVQILRKGWGGDYMRQVVAFECSGVLTVFDAEDVESVEFNVSEAALPTSA